MTEDESRAAFEKWISSPFHELPVNRWSKRAYWQGQYKSPFVQIAWEAWQESAKAHEVKP